MSKPDRRYRLKLKSLSFISAVDRPAQETATALLLKDATGDVAVQATARSVKLSDELGLVFGWAWTEKVAGADYVDLHGDIVVTDDEAINVAAEFMAGARLSDEMHDREADGQIVFAMPMTPEIAKAYGIETDTFGLMIAMKPSAEVFAKFKSGELTGFSIDGTGVREAAKNVAKRGRLTGETDGHQHLVDDETTSGFTSSDSSGSYHSHPYEVVDGVMTIGKAAGHTHDAPAAKRAPTRVPGTSMPMPAPRAITLASAPSGAPTTKTAPTPEKTMDPKILKAIASLTADQLEHLKGLPADEQEAFLTTKTASERSAIVKAALELDPEIEVGGRKIRKSQDPTGMIVEAWKAAEAAQAAAKRYADATGELEIEKRVDVVLKHFGGEATTRKALLRAVEGIADEATRKAVLAELARADGQLALAHQTKGFGGSSALEGSAQAALDAKVAKFAADHKVSPEAALVKLTGNGPEADAEARSLYEQAQAERGAN